MPVLKFGEKLPSVYLDRFSPAENTPTLISVLDVSRMVGLEYHWLDFPTLGVRGMYKCHGGLCCSMMGIRNQSYNVPVYVYKNPQYSTEGELQTWSLTKTTVQQLVDLAKRYDLTRYDLEITATKQGKGTRQAMTIVPGPDAQHLGMRDFMADTQKAQLAEQVEAYFSMAEVGMTRDMSDQEWLQLAVDAGYSVEDQAWLNGTKPLSPQAARGAITGMTRMPVGMAPHPASNAIPSPMQSLGGPAQALAAPQVSPTGYNAYPAGDPTMVQPVVPQPMAQSVGQPMAQPIAQPVAPQPVAPVTPQPVAPQPVTPQPVTPVAPQPVVPQNPFNAQMAAALQEQPSPNNPPISQGRDLTSEELDSILDADLGI